MQTAIDARLDVVEGQALLTYELYQVTDSTLTELVQTEERFHEVKDALKTMHNLDFDKLISSVRSAMA